MLRKRVVVPLRRPESSLTRRGFVSIPSIIERLVVQPHHSVILEALSGKPSVPMSRNGENRPSNC